MVNWRDFNWDRCNPPVDDSRVEAVERSLAVRFPTDYRSCVKQCHGGRPAKREFDVHAAGLKFRSSLAVLLSFSEENSENILNTCKDLEGQLPKGIVPFAEDGGGDYMCFDFRSNETADNPGIIYWHRSGLPENEFSFLANTFSEFLGILS